MTHIEPLTAADLPFLDAAARYLADPTLLKVAKPAEREKAIAAVRRACAWSRRGLARKMEEHE